MLRTRGDKKWEVGDVRGKFVDRPIIQKLKAVLAITGIFLNFCLGGQVTYFGANPFLKITGFNPKHIGGNTTATFTVGL